MPRQQPSSSNQNAELQAARRLRRLLRVQGSHTFTTQGFSMFPSFVEGAHVVVRLCDPQQLRPGEIATACIAGRLVTHRIIGKTSKEILLLGDLGFIPDVIPYACIVGKVVAVEDAQRHAWWRVFPVQALVDRIAERATVAHPHYIVPGLALRLCARSYLAIRRVSSNADTPR